MHFAIICVLQQMWQLRLCIHTYSVEFVTTLQKSVIRVSVIFHRLNGESPNSCATVQTKIYMLGVFLWHLQLFFVQTDDPLRV